MKSIYSKKFSLFIRLVSIFFILIMLCLSYHAFYDVFFEHKYSCIIGLILGPISFALLCIIIIKPEKLALFVPSLIFFSITNSISNSNPAYPIIFMELTAILLWIRGFFNTHKIIKISFLSLIYLVPFFYGITFGYEEFFKRVFDSSQILLITFCIIFLLYEYLKSQKSENKVLNIAEYPETTKRDAQWLNLVQQGVKYEAIAIDYDRTLGTIQNRLNKIYHILETGDRVGFLSIYSNAKIVYQD